MPNPKAIAWTAVIALVTVLGLEKFRAKAPGQSGAMRRPA